VKLHLDLDDEQLDAIAERVAQLLADRQAPANANAGYLDTAAAAEYLSAPRSRIHDLVALGKLEPLRDGRRLLFRRSDLDRYLESA
jgi:excisionase family DNA binding protein